MLDTSIALVTIPTGAYDAGAIVARQRDFLIAELKKAQAADEIVVVATHHPSFNLLPTLGTSLSPDQFRNLLNSYPNVVAHLAGHTHRHRIWDRGGYLEFETSSVIDFPEEGRIIEIWRAGVEVELRYTVFSHLYEGTAFDDVEGADQLDDPYLPMRREAFALAEEHSRSHFLLPVFIHADELIPEFPDLPNLSDLPDLSNLSIFKRRPMESPTQSGTFRTSLSGADNF